MFFITSTYGIHCYAKVFKKNHQTSFIKHAQEYLHLLYVQHNLFCCRTSPPADRSKRKERDANKNTSDGMSDDELTENVGECASLTFPCKFSHLI